MFCFFKSNIYYYEVSPFSNFTLRDSKVILTVLNTQALNVFVLCPVNGICFSFRNSGREFCKLHLEVPDT